MVSGQGQWQTDVTGATALHRLARLQCLPAKYMVCLQAEALCLYHGLVTFQGHASLSSTVSKIVVYKCSRFTCEPMSCWPSDSVWQRCDHRSIFLWAKRQWSGLSSNDQRGGCATDEDPLPATAQRECSVVCGGLEMLHQSTLLNGPRSPDLTSCDFFFVGSIEQQSL